MRTILTATLLTFGLLTGAALAVGDSSSPPAPTETTTKCARGEIFDKAKKACVKSASLEINDDQRYEAVRELAYAGRPAEALAVIATAQARDTPRFLTYTGFALRKMGDFDGAMTAYGKALEMDPDFILARSYMGQGMVAEGDYGGALKELREIADRGGRDSWAYAALDSALRGEPTNY